MDGRLKGAGGDSGICGRPSFFSAAIHPNRLKVGKKALISLYSGIFWPATPLSSMGWSK
jgi:hypothetical protein